MKAKERVASTKSSPEPLPPIGLCQCRCGGRTTLAKSTNRKKGRIKGAPLRFLPGHQNRKIVREIEEDCGYVTPCRIWQLVKNRDGYGRETVWGRKLLAHRAAYERHHGEIEEGLEIDHLCGQHDCVRIDHLEEVPKRENLRRCGKLKLTSEQVIEIRRSTEKQQVVADRYGIDQSQVSRIQAGLVWRDVPDLEMSTHDDPPGLMSIAGAPEQPHEQAEPDPITKLAA